MSSQEVDATVAHELWASFGSRFLNITSKYYAMNTR